MEMFLQEERYKIDREYAKNSYLKSSVGAQIRKKQWECEWPHIKFDTDFAPNKTFSMINEIMPFLNRRTTSGGEAIIVSTPKTVTVDANS